MPEVFWTPEAVIDAIKGWADAHNGEPPGLNDWLRAGYGHPAHTTVQDRFGSWNAGIAAAGFTPRRACRPLAPCGTGGAYTRGCRCELCVGNQRARWRIEKALAA